MGTDHIGVQESDILISLKEEAFINQRLLAETTGHSLGVVNRSIRKLHDLGYLNDDIQLTRKAETLLGNASPRNAIILAAGFGMRMIPINYTSPKAFLEVRGERLIERMIRQLHEAGIHKITVVAGFMKESFEYLIDQYGVDLAVNADYARKNNISSLEKVLDSIHNTYIIPSDIWCEDNPFHKYELYSWYMVADQKDEESEIRMNRKGELVSVQSSETGNRMIGISYLLTKEAEYVKKRIAEILAEDKGDQVFWEAALYEKNRMIVPGRKVSGKKYIEINTYEQLRELDSESGQLKNDAIITITKALNCRENDIKNITVLKKGMTNRSFMFTVSGCKYIMRIPGEGTDQLINREHEAEVFRAISRKGLCDDPVYIDPVNGYKITRYLENVRVCDPGSREDMKQCMDKLRSFHAMKIRVDHAFDVFGQIEFYESLWNGKESVYQDYRLTKEHVFALQKYIDSIKKECCLTHIDAVCDNFLFYIPEGEKEEQLQLTDWEYAGMQDPHVDIAMFCIYSLFSREQCDDLIDLYFEGKCDKETRIKIYCYIAACGLLWSNWCEYKSQLGIEFGEYSLRQYRYAKDFYKYAEEQLERNREAV